MVRFRMQTLTGEGFNLNTLLDKCAYQEPVILLIKTKGYNIFGAYISVPMERSSQYRGNGEMFLFTLVPKPRKFPWTRANQFFMMVLSTVRVNLLILD
jgi:hypothetical protein